MPVSLVTGASGFLGRPLRDALRGSPDSCGRLVTIGRRRPADWPAESFLQADLTNLESLRAAIEQANPSIIYHLAGKTPPASAADLYNANSVATALLLDTLRERRRPVRLILAGSAAELGPVDEHELPVGESHPCRPETPYGLSKWLATCAGLAARPPVEVMVARIFNPIGPGTPESQSLGRFAAQFSDPSVEELSVGCLDTRRDFVDVRDVARALIALARHGRPGLVYHVGTGKSQRVGDGLERLHRLSGERVRVTSDPDRAASAGPGDSRADIRRIVEHTGWGPEISWEASLEDLWNEVRARPRLPLTV
ncbi:GDP-4-dehydro-6-deoxy-D-mannose reductase [Singulisphaera sp. GP187]|uniref:NAD-dependent epimerase/dehydratase family protein n=1 Tax=Singulisphaera sp. GP187 TaxID=1882752 RepID=UPI000929623D|nr:NAD-dependent epimerase/dehydratase family protein [Singulisphaera sp. GP187]SIO59373.1 GDP-4-dehydro-6-deoxy-D-mannose reductase [Singulisphaera sp. GP187]